MKGNPRPATGGLGASGLALLAGALAMGLLWASVEMIRPLPNSNGSLSTRSSGTPATVRQPRPTVRLSEKPHVFATIWHSELHGIFKIGSGPNATAELVKTLKTVEATGVNTWISSILWRHMEPSEGNINFSYLDNLMQAACSNTGLKVGNAGLDCTATLGWDTQDGTALTASFDTVRYRSHSPVLIKPYTRPSLNPANLSPRWIS